MEKYKTIVKEGHLNKLKKGNTYSFPDSDISIICRIFHTAESFPSSRTVLLHMELVGLNCHGRTGSTTWWSSWGASPDAKIGWKEVFKYLFQMRYHLFLNSFGKIAKVYTSYWVTLTDLDSSCPGSLVKTTPPPPGYPWVSEVGMWPQNSDWGVIWWRWWNL